MVAERQISTELAAALHLSEYDVRRLLETSTALASDFTATKAALSSGQITYRHAEKIVEHSRLLPADALLDYESALLPQARAVSPQRLDRLARAAVEIAQPTTAIQRHVDAAARRCLSLDPGADGMAYLTQFIPAVEAVAIYNRAVELARSARSAGDPRTLSQLRADALTDLMLNAETSIPTMTRGIRARVNVTVPALTLLGRTSTPAQSDRAASRIFDPSHSVNRNGHHVSAGANGASTSGDIEHFEPAAAEPTATAERTATAEPIVAVLPSSAIGPAVLDGYGPIDRLTALTLTKDAPGFRRVITDPMTGSVLSYGRTRYRPPADLDDLVRLARSECSFPVDCSSSATADLDHTIAWNEGGVTGFGNLSPLCSSHHKVKHHTEWKIEQSPDGTITWTSPAGFEYLVPPSTPTTAKVTFVERVAPEKPPPF